MKKIMMFVTMFVVAFASYANAADVVKKELIERTTTDKVVASSTTPVAPAKAKAPKKKISGKKKVKKVVSAQVAPAAISPTSAVAEVSPTAQAVSATAVAVTKTAKKSVKFNFNTFSIFMPDMLTSTSRSDHLRVAYGVRGFNSTNSSNQPTGFQTQSSDLNTVEGDLAINLKIWRLGLEYRPLEHRSTLDTKFYGSSIGALDVITSNVVVGKFYAYDGRNWSAFLGLGAESTRIEGSIRMGGFKFETRGEGWSPVLQLGAGYHFNRHWSVEFLYEKSNVVITTTIPGAPDLRSTRDDRMIARLDLGLF